MGHLGRTTGTVLSIFCPDQPESNQMYNSQIISKVLMSNLYTVPGMKSQESVRGAFEKADTANV